MGYIQELRAIIGKRPIILPGCCVFIKNVQGQILMQQRKYPYGKWGLPGGLMELGESTEDTIRREVKEETGLVLGDVTLFGVYSGKGYRCVAENGDEFDVVITVYETSEYEGEAAVMDDESLGFEWFSAENLPDNIAKTHTQIIRDYIARYVEITFHSENWTATKKSLPKKVGTTMQAYVNEIIKEKD